MSADQPGVGGRGGVPDSHQGVDYLRASEFAAAGEHTDRSLILDWRSPWPKTVATTSSARPAMGWPPPRARGRPGGRPRVVDTDKRRIILACHTDGESIRTIARATKVSVGTVHKVLVDHRSSSD